MIVLVGFMGSGKTTVGRLLAFELGVAFEDLDDRIEAAQGRTISDIFGSEGETAFREIEHEELARALSDNVPRVLALGGGAYVQARNRDLLRGKGTVIWLDIPFERALARVSGSGHRPLARDPVKFASLYEQRRSAYAAADYRVPIAGDNPADAVRAILSLPVPQ